MLTLPPELTNPSSLLFSACVALGLILGTAYRYITKQVPSTEEKITTKATDVIIAGGSFLDTTEFKEMGKDLKRIAHAIEELARLRKEQSADEEMEEKMSMLFDKLSKKLGHL